MQRVNGAFLPCVGCGDHPVIELMGDGKVRAFCGACRADTAPVPAEEVIGRWNWNYGKETVVRREP